MEHGLDLGALGVVAGCVVIWGLLSARLERLDVSAPIAFVVMGLLVTHEPLSLIDIEVESATVRHIAELTLALLLFVDASRVNVRELRADANLPVRLLGIGLPLSIAAGAAAAAFLFGGVDLWVAVLIGAIAAPTDAALGAAIMDDERVPARVRRVLNVESGLNDGIVTPFVTVCIAGAVAEVAPHTEGPGGALVDLFVGVGIGGGIGLAGAALLRYARGRGWSAPAFQPLTVLGIALCAYVATVEAGGNGFVAAFVGGMAFGTIMAGGHEPALGFTADIGELLSLLVWFLFGAAMIVPAFDHFVWQDAVFAILALTVVRMLPVAVALARTELDRATVAFIGWFGPRGLASVVFVLIAFDSLPTSDANRVLAVVTITVLLSVVLHGVTASPFAARYGAYSGRLHSSRPEHTAVSELRTRSVTGDRVRITTFPRGDGRE